MAEEKWSRRFTPPAYGVRELRRKIEETRRHEERDTRLLAGLTATLGFASLALWLGYPRSADLARDLAASDHQVVESGLVLEDGRARAVPIQGGSPGVRFYWVLR